MDSPKLSILIPTLEARSIQHTALRDSLYKQGLDGVEVLSFQNKGEKSIGYFRNTLLEWAKGQYVCFIDDDDMVSSDYIPKTLKALESNPTNLSLRGVITWKGEKPEIFEHSIKYNCYRTTENYIKYERYPNHLNVIRADIAKKFLFPDKSFSEDTEWATQVFNSGLLKQEVFIEDVLYHYKFNK